MKKILILSLATLLALSTLTGCQGKPAPVENKKIAVIRNLVQDDHTIQFLEGATQEGEKEGYTVDTFVSGGDDEKTKTLVEDAINNDYAGIVLSHGKGEYSYDLLKEAADKGIKVVTFDTIVNGEIEGLTQTTQNDEQLARLSLEELTATPAKPAKILKIWYSGGMLPFDNRNKVYKQMETDGIIESAGEIDLANLSNVQGDVEAELIKILDSGIAIDGIWACWDEMAKGAMAGLNKAGRIDIKMVSIDISAKDRELMEQNAAVWQATAAVDAKMIGEENVKILIKKLKGETTDPTVLFGGTLYTIEEGKVTEK